MELSREYLCASVGYDELPAAGLAATAPFFAVMAAGVIAAGVAAAGEAVKRRKKAWLLVKIY